MTENLIQKFLVEEFEWPTDGRRKTMDPTINTDEEWEEKIRETTMDWYINTCETP